MGLQGFTELEGMLKDQNVYSLNFDYLFVDYYLSTTLPCARFQHTYQVRGTHSVTSGSASSRLVPARHG